MTSTCELWHVSAHTYTMYTYIHTHSEEERERGMEEGRKKERECLKTKAKSKKMSDNLAIEPQIQRGVSDQHQSGLESPYL